MQIEAKDIEGLVPENKTGEGLAEEQPFLFGQTIGFNQALDLISKKKLEVVIDREKLAQTIAGEGFSISVWDYSCADMIINKAKTDNGLVTIRSVE